MKRTILALLFVGLATGHLSKIPHDHHHGDEEHGEHHVDHHHGEFKTSFRPLCPFLAMLIPKLEDDPADMDARLRSWVMAAQKGEKPALHKSEAHPRVDVNSQQAADYTMLMEKLAKAVETSVVAVYPDLDADNFKVLTVFDIYYEQGSELLRSRWALEVDEATGYWGLWQQGSFNNATQTTPRLPEVQKVVHALKEVGHSHDCKTLGNMLSTDAEFEVVNADEFDFHFMGKHHGHHNHDHEGHDHHRDGHSTREGGRPTYDHLVGRAAVQQVCEKWAVRQSKHITMQFVRSEEMFVRPVYGKPGSYDVLVTGSVEMKTVFADKLVHWPGAVRMVVNKGSSEVTELKVYPFESASLLMKWDWKYGGDGLGHFIGALPGILCSFAVLLMCCCFCACVTSATCSSMWTRYIFARCGSRRTLAARQRPPQAATAQPASGSADLAVPLRSAPLVPAPATAVAPQ